MKRALPALKGLTPPSFAAQLSTAASGLSLVLKKGMAARDVRVLGDGL